MQIYIHRDNQQLGPFTEAEIKAQLASGVTSLQDHVWWEGQQGWVPLAQSSLAATLAPTSPAAPTVGSPLPGTPPAVVPETSKLAFWSLICGCLSVFLSLLASIPAIILGHLGLSQIKKNPGMRGQGMALAGLILGYIFTILLPFISIVAISVLIALGNQVKTVFSTINSQQAVEQAAGSADSSSTTPDQTTNAPDQTAPTPATTNSPDSSTNSSTPGTNASDTSTNAAPMSQ